MRNPDDHDNCLFVIHQVKDAIITLPETIFLLPGQLLCSERAWLSCQAMNFRSDILAIFAGKGLDLSCGRRFD